MNTATKSKYMAWISLDNKKLSCGELEQVLGVKIETDDINYIHYAQPSDRIVTFEFNGDEKAFSALACTQRICKIIETFDINSPPEKLKNQIVTSSYKVDFLNSMLDIDKATSALIYKTIYKTVKNPKVDLHNPQTVFCAYVNKNNVTISQQIWFNDYEYEKRKSHLREKTHSAVMHPKLVRTLVNLSGIVPNLNPKKQYKLLDPFCGTAGILIEAMHCGFHVIGNDIDPKMKSGAKINITNEIKKFPEFSKLCNVQEDIKRISALEIDEKADVIVTDVPYAKNTKKLTPPTLYIDFLRHVEKSKLAKRMVICFPSYANARELIKQTKWKTIELFELPVHNSLTREIYILEI